MNGEKYTMILTHEISGIHAWYKTRWIDSTASENLSLLKIELILTNWLDLSVIDQDNTFNHGNERIEYYQKNSQMTNKSSINHIPTYSIKIARFRVATIIFEIELNLTLVLI